MGAVALCFYAAHAAHYLQRRQPESLLWICHLGAVLVGIGLLTRQGALNAIGTLWLLVGFPLWIYDLVKTGEWLWTSILTHIGGPLIGLAGARKLGVPTGLWWKAVAALLPIVLLSRWVTPPAANINLAHAVYPGWESVFPQYWLYAVVLIALYAAAAFVFQVVSRRLGWKTPEAA